jgi:hypothetical protein
MVVELTTVQVVAMPPIVAVAPAGKPVPVKVIAVAPVSGPVLGVTLVSTGATKVKPLAKLAASRPSARMTSTSTGPGQKVSVGVVHVIVVELTTTQAFKRL